MTPNTQRLAFPDIHFVISPYDICNLYFPFDMNYNVDVLFSCKKRCHAQSYPATATNIILTESKFCIFCTRISMKFLLDGSA